MQPARRSIALVLAGALALVIAGAALWRWSSSDAAPSGPPAVREEVPATATDDEHRPSNNSPQLAVDPTEPRFAVIANRLDAPFGCALQVSGDGGRSWLTVNPVPALPRGADTCYGPEIAFGPDGLLYYLFVGLQGRGNSPMGAFLTTSSDRGRTFSAPRMVLGPERYQVRMALDTTEGSAGRLHLVWVQAGATPPLGGFPPTPNPIMTAHSDDGGGTFSTPIQISDHERPRAVGTALALGPDHSVDVLYYDLQDDTRDYQGLEGPVWPGAWSLVLTRSTDGGEHFTSGRVVDSGIVPPERVMLIYTMAPASLAADASGRLFVAWHDARNGDWDVFLRRSSDGGASWDPPIRLNDDPLHDGRHQYLPRLGVAPSGRIDAIFYDRRVDDANVGTDVYYTYSTDSGRTFSRNQRVSERAFSSKVGPRYMVPSARGLIEFGSRLALVSRDSQVLAAWTDTTNSRQGIKAQDLVATEIDFGQPPGRVLWRAAAGVVLLAAGVLMAVLVAAVWAWPRVVPAAIALALLSGCGPQLPPSVPTVAVTMRDFRYDFSRDAIIRGRLVFRVTNDGPLYHQLALLSIPEDLPPIEEQVRGGGRRVVTERVGTPAIPKGGTDAFAADLTPGRWAFVCFFIGPEGSHATKGMATEFRVR